MRQFQIPRYLKKYSVVIAVLSVIVGCLFYLIASLKLQTYTASTVIEYTNKEAEQGEAPDGSKIDVTEMKASNIISQALINLHYESENIDWVRSCLSIEPVITDEQQKTQDAKIELGEEYEINPTRYLISFTANVGCGKEFPRKMLNEILDVYIADYGKNHVNLESGTNGINDIYSKGYDYIEMMEVIDDSLESVLALLDKKIELNNSFRSYDTGYSFMDLYREFYFFKSVDVPEISASILHQKITKDKNVLLAKYRNRNNDLSINNTASSTETDKIIKIIDTYVEMMSNSDNTNITSDYILDELQENYGYDDDGNMRNGTDQTTEYDRLLEGYVENRTSYEENLIDIAYNKYVLKVYENAPEKSSGELLQETEEKIRELVDKVTNFYQILDKTNDEFNEYLGTANISMLASVGVTERIPIRLFTLFVIVIFGVVGCVGAIVFGRIGDIVDYYAFTNKINGLPNRAKCDHFIASKEKKLLPGNCTCVVFKITNLGTENGKFGRAVGDEMMKQFADVLTSVFVPSDKVFVGDNGAGQYIVFAEETDKALAEAAISQIYTVVSERCEDERYTIVFQDGYACAEQEKCYYIRKLLSIAMKRLHSGGKDSTETPERREDKVQEFVQHSEAKDTQEVFKMDENYYEKFLKERKRNY